MLRYIVRPNAIGKTPRRLRQALGARNTVKVSECIGADYNQDLFLAYPDPSKVANAPTDYLLAYSFYSSNKRDQRLCLAYANLPIVPILVPGSGDSGTIYGPQLDIYKFVVRPLRHSQGRDYRITEDMRDHDERTHYLSYLIPKNREYRALFYRGQHVCTYLKTNPEGIPPSMPWTHANGSRFFTINNPDNDKVKTTGLLAKLSECQLTKTASLIAYDILASGNDLYVCEANLCPGITITGTIDKIVSIEASLQSV